MPATNRFMNTTTLAFNSVAQTGVQSVTRNYGAKTLTGAGDGDLYNTTKVVNEIDISVNVETIEPERLAAQAIGGIHTLVWTQNDAKNGATASGGAIIFTLVNAVFLPQSVSAAHRDFAKSSLTFESASVDGTTSPLSYAAA